MNKGNLIAVGVLAIAGIWILSRKLKKSTVKSVVKEGATTLNADGTLNHPVRNITPRKHFNIGGPTGGRHHGGHRGGRQTVVFANPYPYYYPYPEPEICYKLLPNGRIKKYYCDDFV